MRRAVILLHSPLPPDEILRPRLKGADFVLAVDGGADLALERGIEPDAVLGDLDSLSAWALKWIPQRRVLRRPDPSRTDLEKGVEWLVRRGYARITVVGSNGGRLDHALAALSVLHKFHARARLELVDEHFTTLHVTKHASFRAPKGTIVSLLSPGGARGVTTTGLRWPLKDAPLPFGTLGVHNEVVRSPASVRVRTGHLFLLVGHHVLHHP